MEPFLVILTAVLFIMAKQLMAVTPLLSNF